MKTVKRISLFRMGMILLISSFATMLQAQKLCENSKCERQKTINISTGFDPIAGSLLPTSTAATASQDPNWILTNAATNAGTVTLNSPAFVITRQSGSWFNMAPNAQYLSAFQNPGSHATNMPSSGQPPYVFERKFCLCGEAKIQIQGGYTADNNAVVELLDASRTPINTISSQGANSTTMGNFTSPTAINFTQGLGAGEYYIRVSVRNGNPNPSPSGFALRGTLTVNQVNNGGLLDARCCNQGGFISGIKFFDKNCNGRKDQGETNLSGWTIELKNSSGGVIATAVTDVNGYYAFSNLPSGTYTVCEQQQSGYIQSFPSSGTHSITLNTPQVISNLDFGNCKNNDQSSYCCEGPNLIRNGNFEGTSSPISDYSPQGAIAANSVLPGQYAVIPYTSATSISPQWNVKDPSNCAVGANTKIMVVNGETTQPSNYNNIIWETNVSGLDKQASYKFCAKLKNLPQCTFDVKPKVKVQFSNGQIINWTTINTNASDPCDWQELSATISNVASLNIKILLDEIGKGDGNDVALDDLSLQKKASPSINFSIAQTVVNATDYGIQTSLSGGLPDPSCKYIWLVGELANPMVLSVTNMMWGTNGPPRNWGLTTDFNQYNGGTSGGKFDYRKYYLVMFYVYDCDCQSTGYTYQVIYHHGPSSRSTKKALEVKPATQLKFKPQQEQKLLRIIEQKAIKRKSGKLNKQKTNRSKLKKSQFPRN